VRWAAHVSRTPCRRQDEGDDHSKTPHHMLPQYMGQVRLSPAVWTAPYGEPPSATRPAHQPRVAI
jgi:hypothetical protein